jgi:hypothetical protein
MVRKLACPMLALLMMASIAFSDTAQVTVIVLESADRDKNEATFKVTQKGIAKTADPNGKTVITSRTSTETVTESLAGMSAISRDGAALSNDELWKRLKPGAIVVVGDEDLRQEKIRKSFSPDVVLLIRKGVADAPPVKAKTMRIKKKS